MTYDGAGTGNNAFKANYTYDSDNRLLTERKNYTKRNETEITQYTYDNNGNQLNKLTGISAVYGNNQVSAKISDINELSSGEYENRKYNLFNQLTDVSINGKESKYTYRPDGLRLTKTADGKTTGYIWDEGKIYAETNELFEIQTAYIYGNERINSNNGIYYLYNGHGDVTGLADTTGNITKTYNYDAFGVELTLDLEDVNPFRYCGEYYDKETDSIYLRARYYNPALGRFTTEDPAKDGLNWYVYCNNNPVMFTDPNGLMSMKQFSSVFIPNYFYEACKNTIYSTEVSLKESVNSVYNIVKAVMSGNLDVNLNNFIEAVNPVSGTNMPNTYYVFSHLNYFNQDYVMTDEEVSAFAKSAGKIGLEIARTGSEVYLIFTQVKSKINSLEIESLTVREKLLSSVSNEKLRNCINELYCPGATIGDGGLADAIRYEINTGELVGNKSHINKGIERVKNLENIISKQNLSNTDLSIATSLLADLKDALKLGGY